MSGPKFPLDESLYALTEGERTFFKQQTEISDDGELKAHILRVQAEAYKVCTREPGNSASHAWRRKFITEFIFSKTDSSLPLHPSLLFPR